MAIGERETSTSKTGIKSYVVWNWYGFFCDSCEQEPSQSKAAVPQIYSNTLKRGIQPNMENASFSETNKTTMPQQLTVAESFTDVACRLHLLLSLISRQRNWGKPTLNGIKKKWTEDFFLGHIAPALLALLFVLRKTDYLQNVKRKNYTVHLGCSSLSLKELFSSATASCTGDEWCCCTKKNCTGSWGHPRTELEQHNDTKNNNNSFWISIGEKIL